MATLIDGRSIAEELRDDLARAVEDLTDRGVRPGLATVLMSDDPASETYVELKQQDCEEVGIEGTHVDVDSNAPPAALYDVLDELNADPAIHGILVQSPVPDRIEYRQVVRRIDPTKDVDGFHPDNVGRLVRGDPRFKPCTPHGIQYLLAESGVETSGAEATVVGRSNIVGKPMANLLLQKAEDGNATVTVCHSRTRDLAAHTKRSDIVIAAAGVPQLVDGSMLSEGSTVIDVGFNRVDGEIVGDVDFDSAAPVVQRITPVPGGVGPMTRAMLLYNTVSAAATSHDLDVDLPAPSGG